MAKITYDDKVTLNEQPSIADVNKVTDDDMNEIKSVVNTNDDNVGTLSSLKTNIKTSTVNAINELVDSQVYSTTEVKTNKVWVNNKPIYRKCASIDNYGTLQQDATISFPISNLDEIIWFNLRYYYATGSQYFNIPLVESSGNTLSCNYDKSNGYFKFTGKGSWSGSGRPMAIIVEYTKTTD